MVGVYPYYQIWQKGICDTLIACSIFIAPFLYVLNRLIKSNSLFLSISLSTTAIGVVYLWIIFALFKILRAKKFLAMAITILPLIPIDIIISFILPKMISESFINVWDIMGGSMAVIITIVFFIANSIVQKRIHSEKSKNLHTNKAY